MTTTYVTTDIESDLAQVVNRLQANNIPTVRGYYKAIISKDMADRLVASFANRGLKVCKTPHIHPIPHDYVEPEKLVCILFGNLLVCEAQPGTVVGSRFDR